MQIRCPADDGVIAAQITAALGRRLPELSIAARRTPGALTIVTNGPSARLLPDTVLNRGATLAVNGALRAFTRRGLAPDYWLTIDPQPLVADFLADAPRSTKYLVPSHCHPSVFDALRGRIVRSWHAHHPAAERLVHPSRPQVCTGLTSTIAAIMVGRGLLGFRRADVYGWDGCFYGPDDHAFPQPFSGARCRMTIGTTVYETSPDWIAEARDACDRLMRADIRVHVHGHGLTPALLRQAGVAL